jgi:hypothetical protein
MLPADKHEPGVSDQCGGTDPWPADPSEGSAEQSKDSDITSTEAIMKATICSKEEIQTITLHTL